MPEPGHLHHHQQELQQQLSVPPPYNLFIALVHLFIVNLLVNITSTMTTASTTHSVACTPSRRHSSNNLER